MKKPSNKFVLVFTGTVVAIFLCLAYSYYIEPRRLVINRSELRVKNWNPAFDGLKIAMIGDIHGGSNAVDNAKLNEIVQRTNAEEPDFIVLLGDYVSQTANQKPPNLKMPMSEIADGLSGLKARYGVYAVLGNHDGRYCDDCVRTELTRVGYQVLENDVAMIEKDGYRLRIIGLPDHLKIAGWSDFSNNAKQKLVPTDGLGDVIALEHSPDVLPVITGSLSISPDLKVILAAHTHGGQVWLPIFGTPIIPSSYGQKYSYGHIRENNVDMFVTSGIGTSILPIRFMMPPEIVMLTIKTE
ncbi:MAG: metallophosphoesterase [Acidobacteriota bacterium]